MRKTPHFWRCFPWDPAAPEGAPFSPSYIAGGQSVGRFDLHDQPPVLYLAESPEHAVGEALAEFRGTRLRPQQLMKFGRDLALVRIEISRELMDRIPDCTDPSVLAKLGLRPDQLAHHDRRVTQAIARQLHGGLHAGLRWWSALTGAWHPTALFADRIGARDLSFGEAEALSPDHSAVLTALPILGIRAG